MSGSDTISINGTPDRFTSTSENRSPASFSRCSNRAVSSSRCTRVIPIRRLPSVSVSTSIQPPSESGMSYCEIWYPFIKSG